ncbi:MAG: hypothetical protein E7449_07230 [Ruminococcaceae bacterium]|nr:hypothetical protein [Oscillospiraceae bacterium]
MSIVDTLIYDRTEAERDALEALYAKAKAGDATDEEMAILTDPTHKGAYNYTDLNRVGKAIVYIANRLKAAGNDIEVSPKTNWTREDIPAPAQMVHYLEQIQKVRDVLTVYQTTPAVPADMEGLTHTEANDIEKILVDVDQLITNMIAAYYYSGELYGGEV